MNNNKSQVAAVAKGILMTNGTLTARFKNNSSSSPSETTLTNETIDAFLKGDDVDKVESMTWTNKNKPEIKVTMQMGSCNDDKTCRIILLMKLVAKIHKTILGAGGP